MQPANVPLVLRDYQKEAIQAVQAAVARGVRRFVVSMPTGSGKTATFAALAAETVATGGRVLALTHTDETVTQIVRAFQADTPLGVVKAKRDEHTAPVVVASVQTLSKPHRLDHVTPDFALVVVDECHHAVADSYRRVLAHLSSQTR